jgi:ubiquitin-protein ligase
MNTLMKRASRIITNQLNQYIKDPLNGIDFYQDEQNILNLSFTLIGPKETPWEDIMLKGIIVFPENYPFSPPKLQFLSRTFHPNIYPDGKICLSILNDKQDETGYFKANELWSPVLDIRSVFLCIQNLFTEPNLESPANLDACIMYRNDLKGFTKMIRKEYNL